MKRIIVPTLVLPQFVEGKIGAAECCTFLDSGADVTMLKASLVKDSQYTQENNKIIGVNGMESSWRLAKVWIHDDSFSITFNPSYGRCCRGVARRGYLGLLTN